MMALGVYRPLDKALKGKKKDERRKKIETVSFFIERLVLNIHLMIYGMCL